MQTLEEFVKSNDPDKISTFDEIDDRIKLIRARDAEWQARVKKLEAAMEYALACLPDAPLNAKDKLRTALGREV